MPLKTIIIHRPECFMFLFDYQPITNWNSIYSILIFFSCLITVLKRHGLLFCNNKISVIIKRHDIGRYFSSF